MAILSIEEGPGCGAECEIPRGGECVVGRSSQCHMMIPDNRISRAHFRIEADGAAFLVSDLASQNGTYVNGVRIDAPTTVCAGDVISAGSAVMRIREDTSGSLTGRVLAGYHLEQRLGAGGMGEVYRAKQLSLGRTVALKVLYPKYTSDKAFVKRFFDEARAAGQLNHPNVAHVFDVGEADGSYFYSMECLPGGTVQQLARDGAIDPLLAVDIVLQAARGLQYAESKGIVHCDIKPANLMLTADDEVRLTDLGIAKRAGEANSPDEGEGVFGSPHYMSPEQARGEALDHRSDLYSLGATFYRLLAGEPPFSGETSRAVMEKQVFEKPRPVREINSTVPKVLAGICARLLEKDPAARYQSATDLIEDLEDAREEIEGEPDFPVVEAPPLRARGTRREPRVRPRAPRRNWVELIGVCAGVLMLLGLVYLLVDYMGRGERAFRQGLVLKEQGKLVESEKALERALALAGGGSLASQIRRHLEEVKEKIVSVQETARVQKVVERAKARAAAGGAELARAINALEAEVDSSWVGRDIASGPLAEFQGRLRDEAAAELAARKDKAEAFLAEGALADAFGVYDEFPAHYEGTSAFGEARRAAGEVRSRGATQYLATARKVETLLDEGRLRPEAFAEAQKLLGPFAFRSGVPDISSDAQRMLDEVKRAVDASEEDKRAEDARRRIARVEGLVRRGRVLARRYHYDEANRATREAQNALRALGRHDRLAELDAYVGSIGRQRQLFDALVRWLREGAVVAETIVLPGGARVRVTGVRPADMDFYIRTEGGEDRRLPWDQLPPSEVLKLYGAMPSEPYWQLLAVEFCLEHGLVREARGLMAAVRRVRPEDKARAEALAARAEAADPDRRPDEQDAETLAAWASEAAGQGKPDEARGLIELLRTRYALTQAASADRLEEIEAAVRRGGG